MINLWWQWFKYWPCFFN